MTSKLHSYLKFALLNDEGEVDRVDDARAGPGDDQRIGSGWGGEDGCAGGRGAWDEAAGRAACDRDQQKERGPERPMASPDKAQRQQQGEPDEVASPG